jgi:hypothetical protein
VAKYTYVTADLRTGTVLEELPLTGVRYSHVLNGAGALNANIHYHHPKATLANLDPGARTIWVRRNDVVVWGGILWTVRKIKGNDLLSLGAEGFHSYFTKKRRIRNTLTFTNVDQHRIVRDLVRYAQGQQLLYATGTPTYPQPGGGYLDVSTDSSLSGNLRTQTYNAFERKSIGEAISQMAARIDGFDFSYELTNDHDITFTTWYPRRGRRTNLTFEQGANVTLLAWLLDATRMENRTDAIGAGEGDSMLIATAQDTNLLNRYPVLDGTLARKDVSVQSTLQSHADAELRAKKNLIAIPQFSVRMSADSDIGSFITGDEVVVRASDGFVQIDGYYRIQEYLVDVSNEGNEDVEFTFVDTEAV